MKIRALKIDVTNRLITEVEITKGLKDIYRHLDCRTVDAIRPSLAGLDMIYIDDEGLFVDEPNGAFSVRGYSGVYAGNGLVVGTNMDGESIDAQTSLESLKQRIRFEEAYYLPSPAIYIL